VTRLEIDGRSPTIERLYHPILVNYGHFTAMQVRGGRTRGLELHLRRLVAASRELFAAELDPELVRSHLRHALRDIPDAAVRINVYQPGELMIMVVVRPPLAPPEGPLSLRSVLYERPAAHLKHLGGFGQIHHGRTAQQQGFDDALLVTPEGAVAESAIHNIGFFDGAAIAWPTTPHLPGIMLQLLAPRLTAAGLPGRDTEVHLADLKAFRAAFVTNSIGVAPVARIDDVVLPVDAELMRRVGAVVADIPWDEI